MSNPRTMKFFAYLQMTGKELLYKGELQSALGISLKQEENLLAYLVKRGTIIRLKPGIYLAPSKIPPGGKWQPGTLYLVSCLMDVYEAKYYIGGLYAFNYHGLSEQVPNKIVIYNDKLSGVKKIGVLEITLIKIPSKQIGKPQEISVNDQLSANISTLSRTIVDAVKDWKRFGTMPTAFEWIDQFIDDTVILKNLICDTIAFGNISTRRRIGYYLLKKTSDKTLVKPILESLTPTKNWVPLDPLGGTKGKTDKVWRIIDNAKDRQR